ncbi:MAG: NADH-quinone oxidoreductase subunit NuoE [Bacteroidetes bacterium HGW-Bacteroidetes-1]|jgi:NADH-quinone oxidoreductase subunit E|nr:MAG: NADH-quinone oxidoreductase subunit NuoE [Bacteroidetes bacterium HGW-Bacteroidetes-1]
MRIQRIVSEKTQSPVLKPDLGMLNEIFAKYRNKSGSLIPLLQGTQHLFGYIPADAFEMISKETGIPQADIYGVATFYAQFRLHPVGKNVIKVCHGTACHVQNANAITDAIKAELGVKDGGTTDDGFFTLESVACLGCCSLAPVMMIEENSYGKLTGKSAVKVIREMRSESCVNKQ